MKLIYSKYWFLKKKYRKDISDYFLEMAITNSNVLNDKYWKDAFNAIFRIPDNGRKIKVVYKIIGKKEYKILTAFWLD